MLQYSSYITRRMVIDNRNSLFVFGDNLQRFGFGGQAKEMRGEINSVGIPTKIAPHRHESAFFTDEWYDKWLPSFDEAEGRLMHHTGLIVWPYAGIGTGRAQLEKRAPKIWAAIEQLRTDLDEK